MKRQKKKMGDRVLSVLLVILLAVNLLPLTMQASDNHTEEAVENVDDSAAEGDGAPKEALGTVPEEDSVLDDGRKNEASKEADVLPKADDTLADKDMETTDGLPEADDILPEADDISGKEQPESADIFPMVDGGQKDTLDTAETDADINRTEDAGISPAVETGRYTVSAAAVEHGTVSFSATELIGSVETDQGGSAAVTITPDENYRVKTIQIKNAAAPQGTPVDLENALDYVENQDGTFVYTVTNITQDTEIAVEFEEFEELSGDVSSYLSLTAASGELKHTYTDDAGNTVYVYAKNSEIRIEPVSPYNQLSLKYEGKETYQPWSANEIITASCEIKALRVRAEKKQNAANVRLDKKIIVVLDNDAPSVLLNAEKAHKNTYYNKNFTVDIEASDTAGDVFSSGISKVEYQVTCGDSLETIDTDAPTQAGVLYEAQPGTKGIDKYNKTDCENYQAILIDAKKNNSDYVRLAVTTTDLSGNTKTETKDFKISTKIPEIKVEMQGTSQEGAKNSFYTTRKAVISITERTSVFNSQAVMQGLKIAAKNFAGDNVNISKDAMLSEWETVEGSSPDATVHKATLTFAEDARYEWSVSYENNAGISVDSKENADIEVVGENVWNFTVDTQAPTESTLEEEKSLWGRLADKIGFAKFFNYSITVTADPKDEISPVADVSYYKTDAQTVLNAEQLHELWQNGAFTSETLEISSEEAFVAYARLMDNAGNVCYISTDGVVVDMTEAEAKAALPEAANKNGFYNSDVKVDISVNEKIGDKAFSGIKSVAYAVECDGKVTKKETIYVYDASDPMKTVYDTGKVTIDDVTKLPETFEDSIVVNAVDNNGDQVRVKVTVEDNAGNFVTGESKPFSINSVKPTCEVSFDDKAKRLEDGYGWYRNERTATVVITDRESTFNPDAAEEGIVVTGKNMQGEAVAVKKAQINWSVDKEDSSKHVAKIKFADSARYEWSITYTNKADLGFTWEEVVKKGQSVSSFTVDNDVPGGTITVGKNIWDSLLEKLTFGLYSKGKLEVRATAEDVISPVTIQYYKTSNPIAMKKGELDKKKFSDYKDFSVSPTEQFVVYLKISDYAGNYIYINSDGVIVDNEPSKVSLKEDEANENNIYNKNVNVVVTVEEETEAYAGIKTVEYWAEADGRETQRGTLYSFTVKSPTQEQLKKEWKGTVTLDAKKNNSSDVIVYVRTEDNAGNVRTVKSKKLDIDVTKPKITISYDNNEDNGGNGYFNDGRTAVIEIQERTNHFRASKAEKGITITAVDAKGKAVDVGKMVSSFKTKEGRSPDEAVHRATIKYSKDANYTFAISYTDEAGNENAGVDKGSSVAPYKFTVDKAAPIGTVSSKTAEGRSDSWDKLVSRLTFGIWSASRIEITAVTDDATSPVTGVEYYKTSDTSVMTKSELGDVTDWKDFKGFSVKANEQFTVYLKITDKAGNIAYISTNGMIVDGAKPRTESIAPEVTISPEQPINGIYNRNVKVDIKVQDPIAQGTYSGLKTVSYRILNMGAETQNGVLYAFDKASPLQSQLRKEWSGSITVDSTLNNSNDVVIEIYAEDNALNSSIKTESIKIDVSKPQITVRYDNNNPDSEKYYKDSRTATIVINERNFDPKDIIVTITNTEGAVPSVSEWTTGAGDGNLDNTPHTATVTYEADGDYTFDITYTDLALNVCDGENYVPGTTNGTEFTIDKTVPTIAVSYDNNEAAQSRYFKANRTATVTIQEHNFDVGRVQFTQTATLDGIQIAAPAPAWSNNGDTHTATISYNTDGDYTFDVTMTDMAGNESSGASYGSDIASKEFTVDTKIGKPMISGVENGKAYKGDVVPVIDFSDINYDDYSIELKRTNLQIKNEDVKDQFIENADIGAQGGKSVNDTFEPVRENDGIYTLEVKFWDKAGNEETEKITFTLNRFGSVYEYSDSLLDLIKEGGAYVREVDEDIEITEYNADRLVDGSLAIEVTKDGKPMSDLDYAVSPEINDTVKPGDSGWYQYSYRIGAGNFKEDGVYKVTVSSEDETGNTPENTPENTDYKENAILFRVDSTPPEITSVTGLEHEVVNDTQVEVGYDVYDTIGLKSVTVKVKAGKEAVLEQEITDFKDDGNNYHGEFVLPENTSAQDVQIIAYDMADNVVDTGSENFKSAYAFHHLVTVSTNFFVRWYADQALFWGSIVGVVAILCAAIAVVVFMRRKRVKD